eukprot:TRINITY_DN3965_c0_g2_i1.p1 TRINITY_DN3965_c0_g2~~TRINITY_DN3965_c0_g2_i1.p1  ORF type:complete len:602 (+),score=153.66 TRINITY_DN3965_c0_g2_i1:27-1832(+)
MHRFFLLLFCWFQIGMLMPIYSLHGGDFAPSAFNEWIIANAAKGFTDVGVAAGTYSVDSGNSGSYPITLWNIHNLTMWFNDVTLIFLDITKAGLMLDQCSNIAIRGLSTTYAMPTSSQARVNRIFPDPSNSDRYYIDLEVAKGYPNEYFYWQLLYAYVFNGQTLQPYEPSYNTQIFPITRESLSSDNNTMRWLITKADVDHKIAIGDYVAVRGYFTQFYSTKECRNISFIDITIYQCGGFAWVSLGGDGGHLYQRVAIRYGPPPIESGMRPLVTCSADGIHHVASHQGPRIIDSLFEGMQDDGINLQGVFANVSGIRETGELELIFGEPWDFLIWKVGDRLRFYNPNYDALGYATIFNLKSVKDVNWHVIVTVNASQTLLTKIRQNDIVTNIDRQNNDFLIHNNTFRWHRARAMLIKASNGMISNNIINGTSIGGIHLNPERTYFSESDYPQNVTIQNNWINNVAFFYGAGSISVFATVNGPIPNAGGSVNIVIKNNTIVHSVRDNIRVYSSFNATIQDNVIVGPLGTGFPAVDMINVDTAWVLNNCVVNATAETAVLISMKNVTWRVNPVNGVRFCSENVPDFPRSPWDGRDGMEPHGIE